MSILRPLYIRYWILFFYFYLKFYYLNIYDKLFSLERRCIEIFNLKIFNYDMTIFSPKKYIFIGGLCIYFYLGSFLVFLNKNIIICGVTCNSN